MKARTNPPKATPTGEPMGIVISRGRDVEPAPVFSAYMYAPAPEADTAAAELTGV